MVVLDPYQLLGVQRSATTAEIASAYEHLWAIFDPGRWSHSPSLAREAEAWVAAIDEARRTALAC